MPLVVVGSANPVKQTAIREAFEQMLPDREWTVRGVDVDSGVRDQPLSDAETLRGAFGRMAAAREAEPSANYWVGIEGGIDLVDNRMDAFAWIVVQGGGVYGRARTATFPLPVDVMRLVHEGVELGHANDRVFGLMNSKQQGGAVGALSDGLVDRVALYRHAAILALIPVRNEQMTFPDAAADELRFRG